MSATPHTAFVPAWLDDLDLTPQQFRLYAHICRRGKCFEAIPRIARACRVCGNTVKKDLKELVRQKLLLKTPQPGRPSIYEVNPYFKDGLFSNPGCEMTQVNSGKGASPFRELSGGAPNGSGADHLRSTKVEQVKELKGRNSCAKERTGENPGTGEQQSVFKTSFESLSKESKRVKVKQKPVEAEETRKRFRKPSYDELVEEFQAKGVANDESESLARGFQDYYESNGWKVGRNPMKSWKHAVANWLRNQRDWNDNKHNTNGSREVTLGDFL